MSPRLVIRHDSRWRRSLVLVGAALLLPLVVYAAFELGRYRAGYDLRDQLAARGELRQQIRALEQREREQRVQMAALESAKIGQNRERTEVSRTIGELQAQVARQAQDLAFYRGIVGDSGQAPIKIQQLRIVPATAAQHYIVKMVLGRPLRPEDAISGTLGLTLEGSEGLLSATRDLAQITADARREIPFNFRYLQPLDIEIEVPNGFRPQRLTVELRPARKGVTPLRQTFLWSPEPA
jgi:hypothetical protein